MILFYFILFLATLFDFKSYKIPNPLVIVGTLFGLGYHLITGHPGQLPIYFLSTIFIWIVTTPLFALRVIGGGDCKLFCVCASFVGVVRTLTIGIYSFFISGAFCAIYLLWGRIFPGKKQVHTVHFTIYILLGAWIERIIGGRLWGIESLFLIGKAGL